MNNKTVAIDSIKSNDNNPRFIKEAKFLKLVQSIKQFPQMLKLRPIVVDEDMKILGGNMRHRAAKDAGLTEIPITIFTQELCEQANAERIANGLPLQTYEEMSNEFVIKDNASFGDWDWDVLANEYDMEVLEGWGLDIPEWRTAEDIDIESFEVPTNDRQSNTVQLNFTTEQKAIFDDYVSSKSGSKEEVIEQLITTYGK